ncbi:hypothetical protein NMG60_11019897 [Bertholletia excelsa]
MGCASSKLDDQPAVALCRERCSFLDEAIQQRYKLAEAHLAYMHSLKAVGGSLRRFFDQDLGYSAAGPPSPVLNLPPQRKGDTEPSGEPPQKAIHQHSHSNSGSHLHFQSDSDLEDSVSESPLHHYSEDISPLHPYNQGSYADPEALNSYPAEYMNMNMNINYMKSKATPSVSYEQRPMSPETVHMGESSSYYPYPYANQNPSSYSYYGYPGYGDGMSSFYGAPAPAPSPYGAPYQQPPVGQGAAASLDASTSKPPPPPPSPPRISPWEFLNPFDGYERYPSYTPSRDSKELREAEGIPDLEEEDFQQEVVKEVHGNEKFVDGGGSGSRGQNYGKAVVEDEDVKAKGSESLYNMRPNFSENDPVEYEVHMVDKKVVDAEEKSGDRGNVATFKVRGDSEVVREIQVQFERASESGSEVAKMLEVGKFPYKKNAAYQVSSKMLHVITPPLPVVSSQPSTSKDAGADPVPLDTDEEVGTRHRNLSSILHQLYLWEKKLYEEVKVEEKMRVEHERKSRKLKHLDEKGAEAHKVDKTRTLVRSLSTKIRIAIQIVDNTSVKINKLRDEELWPKLNEIIQGLTRMWKSMLECHHSQCQAIGQARQLDAVASHKHSSDARLEATQQLVHELINWAVRFSCWFGAQKGYVRALNNWLLKCLLYVPEETPDGIVPFSPGRIGAPSVFVICNQWSQALQRISDKEVVDSMRNFANSVLQLWKRDKQEMRNKMTVGKDMERKVKSLERDDQKIHKEIQALNKRMVLASADGNGLSLSGNVVYQSETSKNGSLQVSLQHIFESMERFTAELLKTYEELLQRIEEDRQDRLARDSEKVS